MGEVPASWELYFGAEGFNASDKTVKLIEVRASQFSGACLFNKSSRKLENRSAISAVRGTA
jgi:hypothetical protein